MNARSLAGLALIFLTAGTVATQPRPTPSERMKLETASLAKSGGPIVVDDESVVAKNGITARAKELLKNRNYRALDAMAAELRRSPKTYANGDWPIAFFFGGVVPLAEGSSNAEWEAHIEELRNWFENSPDSITPRVAMARGLMDYAWEARGGGWASTVSNDGWRLFRERITEARRILNAAEDLGRICPVYYSSRLRVALADGVPREEYDRLFKESIEAFPTYWTFYLVKVNYLLPRWYGEEREWESFAATSADQTGGEDGDMLYARIVWDMHDARYFGNIFQETAVEWPRVQRGFEALCRRYPNSISAPSEYCYLAGFAPEGGRRLARALLTRLDDRIDLSVWKTMERWTKDRAWAFAEN